ncbi:MAG: hypothetical protein M3220_11640 [Chloroflexota bacterium]|nr:hypothetical protein [Chloroflexota bacterium]
MNTSSNELIAQPIAAPSTIDTPAQQPAAAPRHLARRVLLWLAEPFTEPNRDLMLRFFTATKGWGRN